MGYFDGKIHAKNPTGWLLPTRDWTAQEKQKAREMAITIPSGYTMPLHYLTPMTRAQINDWAWLFMAKKQQECETSNGQGCSMKAFAYTVLEIFNLAYVNGYTTWDQLQAIYKETGDFLQAIPEFPKFKEQLKNMGQVAIAGVSGFITGGPVGLFAGVASASSKIISDERLRKAKEIQNVVAPNVQSVSEAMQAREASAIAAEQSAQKKGILGIGALMIGGGILIYALND